VITKPMMRVLERAFALEVERGLEWAPELKHLPLQVGRSQAVRRCIAEGLLQERSATLGGRLPMSVHGVELTHAGRFAYCATCKDEDEPA